MKVLLAIAGVVAVWGTATVLVVDKFNDPDGADTPQIAADSALQALSAQDKDGLLKVADPDLSGREQAARRLIDQCRGSDFSGARVTVLRSELADYLASGIVTVPHGQSACREFDLEVRRRNGGWFLSLATPEPNPNPLPTAATNR
ncbi:hypothetical protein E1263_21415 [Kribbella antibiotica]|uniref:Uncharacterized protein n=1 Tax=Kribbella antibiotica TaxID=190195 RepID=A0A4R4ZJI5_9ACTN|nr:hypothetical protein [Kribbella antibiotica]TDD57934.1 hypothetical protein E1263_21415 [Kribbella antibiotica]